MSVEAVVPARLSPMSADNADRNVLSTDIFERYRDMRKRAQRH